MKFQTELNSLALFCRIKVAGSKKTKLRNFFFLKYSNSNEEQKYPFYNFKQSSFEERTFVMYFGNQSNFNVVSLTTND